MSEVRLRVHYELRLGAGETAREKALGIAREQTVELDLALVPESVREAVAGRLEAIEAAGPRGAHVTISYALATVGDDLPQLLNLLFGNISMQVGIRLAAIDWPEELLARFAGPRLGIPGLRELARAPRRPLLCAALKPLGLSPAELAVLAGRLARGGIDFVKDDHSLADQPWAPFAERVARCQEAVAEANAATGGCTCYLPNLTGPADRLSARAAQVRELGCRAALVAPLLVGCDNVRRLAATIGLALIGHPSLTGGLLGRTHGLAPALLWGDLFRLAGCDGVVYPNAGGRFGFSLRDCLAVADSLRRPLGALHPAFPVLGGGMDAAKIRRWRRAYGDETIFLLGGSLLGQRDIEAGARALRAEVERGR